MEQLTLQQLFGANAYQDGQILRINKSDLPGLTLSGNNSAESLLAAILLNTLEVFQGIITDESGNSITDEYENSISYENSEIFEEMKLIFWGRFFTNKFGTLYVTNQLLLETYAQYQWFT